MESDLGRRFGFLLHDVSRLMRKRFDRRAQKLGLTRSQWQVIAHLYRLQGVNQTTLANVMELSNITLARLVDRLEAAGWVERKADPTDRRAKCLHLTEKTYPMLEQMQALGNDVQAEALAGLSPAQHVQLIDTLVQIKNNLLALEGPDSPLPASHPMPEPESDAV